MPNCFVHVLMVPQNAESGHRQHGHSGKVVETQSSV